MLFNENLICLLADLEINGKIKLDFINSEEMK